MLVDFIKSKCMCSISHFVIQTQQQWLLNLGSNRLVFSLLDHYNNLTFVANVEMHTEDGHVVIE